MHRGVVVIDGIVRASRRVFGVTSIMYSDRLRSATCAVAFTYCEVLFTQGSLSTTWHSPLHARALSSLNGVCALWCVVQVLFIDGHVLRELAEEYDEHTAKRMKT